jgi:hypothetical protein
MVHLLSARNTLGIGAGDLPRDTVMRVMFLLLFCKMYGKLNTGSCDGELGGVHRDWY